MSNTVEGTRAFIQTEHLRLFIFFGLCVCVCVCGHRFNSDLGFISKDCNGQKRVFESCSHSCLVLKNAINIPKVQVEACRKQKQEEAGNCLHNLNFHTLYPLQNE